MDYKNNLNKIKSKGFALIGVILILLIIGALIGVGAKIMKPTTKKVKFVESKDILQAAVDSVISYAAANDQLPNFATFQTIVRDPNDAFTRPLIYAFDNNFTTTVCGRKTAALTVGTADIAFVVVSDSDNYQTDATIDPGTGPVTLTSGAQTGSFVQNSDLAKWVTVEELRAKAGCAPAQLRIVNNELPAGTATVPYNATIYADGGYLAGANYKWCVNITNLPPGLNDPTIGCTVPANCASVVTDADWIASPSLSIGGTPTTAGTTYNIIVFVRDDDNNCAEKTLPIEILASPGPPGGGVEAGDVSGFEESESPGDPGAVVIDPETGTISLGGNEGGTTYGCAWNATNFDLVNYKLRAYFDFTIENVDTHSNSRNYGYGFTFAVMEENILTSECGEKGDDMGFGGISRKGVAVEFDTYPDVSQKNDPSNRENHVAIVLDGNNKHNTGGNPACVSAGCYSQTSSVTNPSARWLEDNQPHGARIELDPTGGSGGTAKIEVWICDGSGCDSTFKDLSADYTSTASPTIKHDFTFPSEMNNVKLGFTEGTSGQTQLVVLSNFVAEFW